MTYPQQYPPQQWQAPYPQQPQQQQPQAWAPPQYPQQGYPQQGYPQAPAEPVRTGSIDDFYGQPSGAGGPSLKFNQKPNGTTYVGIVARKITNGDIRQQTDQSGRPVTFKDGRPKWIMVVPLLVQASPEFPDGTASWWVKGQARDELVRAMAEAGAPEGPPEEGAAIQITKTGERPIPNMTPQILYSIRYARPQGAAPVQQQPAPQPEAPNTPEATHGAHTQIPEAQQPQAHSTQVWNAVAPQQPVTGAQAAPQQPQAPAPAQTPQVPAQPTTDALDDAQKALLAQLTGQAG